MTFVKIPNNYCDFDLRKEKKKTLTKTWFNLYKRELFGYRYSFSGNISADKNAIKTVLCSGYGVNIGCQIFDLYTEADQKKFVNNLFQI